MTYFPFSQTAETGEAYFTSIGLIGGSTGLAPLITNSSSITAFSDSDGTALIINGANAVGGDKQNAVNAVSWSGYNFGSAITKGLIVAQVMPSASDYIGVGFHTGTLPTGALEDSYESRFNGAGSASELHKYVGDTASVITSATTYQNDWADQTVFGIGIYVDGDNDVQKFFQKTGGQWVEVISGAADDHDSFQSCYLRSTAESCRFICPIYCWGA
tara:strand:+ start:412 stop:1059 length:648 start_codon:yes stop_codon:yes gene_type:complete